MQSDTRHSEGDSLWLGSVVVPRSKGVCGLALENSLRAREGGDDITIIQDLQQHPRSGDSPFAAHGTQLRFYAGVPIRTLDGHIIGIYSILDSKPRTGLSPENTAFLRDLAKTTMDHLEAVKIRTDYARMNKFVTGVESFIDGLAENRSAEQATESRATHETETSRNLALKDVATSTASDVDFTHAPTYDDQSQRPRPTRTSTELPGLAPRSLWESAMPLGSKTMLSRAATILRQSGDYDGVSIFYMASHRKRHSTRSHGAATQSGALSNHFKDGTTSGSPSPSPEETSADSDTDGSGADSSNRKGPCPLLSYSFASKPLLAPNEAPFPRFQQRDLDLITGRTSKPRTFTLNRAGEVLPGDTSSSGSGVEKSLSDAKHEGSDISRASNRVTTHGSEKQRRQIKSLKKLSQSALSFASLPIWDSERQRCLAYCICWTSSPARHLKEDGTLTCLRIFGNSITIALSHIDAVASDKAKSTFVSSMSHELRSPLHGVLSATNFLNDGNLNRFQQEMVDVISNCGRTLLDTVDHVMDFAKISSLVPRLASIASTIASSPTASMQAPGHTQELAMSSNFDLSVLVEEVIESVLMGFGVQHDFLYADDDPHDSLGRLPAFNSTMNAMAKSDRVKHSRGRLRVVLQIAHEQHWCVQSQAGAWRRIIMNLFGNALKYTEDGCVIVRIGMIPSQSKVRQITLEVDDTGKGMSKHYMATRLYTPFSQENDFASGTGLGLSIVKQIVGALGGHIVVDSTQGVGTHVRVKIAVPSATPKLSLVESAASIEAVAERLRGHRVYILDDESVLSASDAVKDVMKQSQLEFMKTLLIALKDWFNVDATTGDSWPSQDVDLVICLKPVLRYLEPTTADKPRPSIVLITHDALEMAVLRADARVLRDDIAIEIVSQPLGPRKLARTLDQCLQRREQLTASRARENGVEAHAESRNASQTHIQVRDDSPAGSRTPRIEGLQLEDYREPCVLIVDDNKVNLRLLSVFVKRRAFKYHEAANGQMALNIFKAAAGAVRCVLMDISMPVMDGMTATRQIRAFEKEQSLARTPVIALTGLTSAAARQEASEAGMDEFLTKPISFDQLNSMLASVADLPRRGDTTLPVKPAGAPPDLGPNDEEPHTNSHPNETNLPTHVEKPAS